MAIKESINAFRRRRRVREEGSVRNLSFSTTGTMEVGLFRASGNIELEVLERTYKRDGDDLYGYVVIEAIVLQQLHNRL